MNLGPERIIFFDGYCGFCSLAVDWLLPRDRKALFLFAPIQGKTAQARLAAETIRRASADTILYLRGPEMLERSTAVLSAMSDLGGPWSAVRLLLLVPRPIRDFFYDCFARHRNRFFGRRSVCRLPSLSERGRILE